jgi:hypothetical protein
MVELVSTVTGAAKGRSGTGESSVETTFMLLLLLVLHLVLLLLRLTATSASAVRITKGCPEVALAAQKSHLAARWYARRTG